jgi:hypothetical protein
MRRCDRRLFPILKEWITVDVVITQFEIVYFDAHIDEANNDSVGTQHHLETSLLALRATKGGKGLRLCDVAAGRKVVGHLDLAGVTELHVDRDVALADLTRLEETEALYDLDTELPSEYWSTPHVLKGKSEKETISRQLRWAKITEDRLKLVSIHETLVLRFYSDLDDIEAHLDIEAVENEGEGPLKKDVAFQWAQTIAHCCGREQLKQSLPHYGEGGDAELRDYLEVVHYHEKESEETCKSKKGHQRKNSSIPNLPQPSRLHQRSTSDGTGSTSNRKTFSASKSFGEEAVGKRRSSVKKSLLRRSVSSEDCDSNGAGTGGPMITDLLPKMTDATK